jgi:hypothetical protein
MALSDDIFRNIASGSKEAAEQLKKMIEQFKQAQSLASKGMPSLGQGSIKPNAFSSVSASFGQNSATSSLQNAINNMNAIHSLRGGSFAAGISPPNFRLPFNTSPAPVNTPLTGIPAVDGILSSMRRGMSGDALYRSTVNMARNPTIAPDVRASGIQSIINQSGRLGGILSGTSIDRLTNGNMGSLQYAAARQSMQASYHAAMQESNLAKRHAMLQDLEKNAPLKYGRDYEYIKRGIERTRQASTDKPFMDKLGITNSASQLVSLRESAVSGGASVQILDRIDKKLGKLNETAEKQQRKEERIRSEYEQKYPILSKIIRQPTANLPDMIRTVGQTAADLSRSFYGLTGSQLQSPINTMFAQSEYERAKQERFLSLGSDFSGEGRLRAAGNILLAGRASTPFLGKSGFDSALAVAGMNTEQKGQRTVLEKFLALGTGVGLAVGGGALALSGVGSVAGAGLLATGGSMIANSVSGAFSSNDVRATGILGNTLQNEANAVRNQQTYGLAQSLQQAEVDRNILYGRQIDAAESQYAANRESIARMGRKAFTMESMSVMGGGIPNLTRAESMQFAKMTPIQREMFLNGRLASGLGRGNTSWDRATALGMDSAEYTSNISRTQYSLGVRGGGAEATGGELIRMSRSGYGSMEQLLGNMSSLSGISGKGNSLSDLKAILGAAVAAGFDGSRLGQKFVETTARVASSLNLMDVDRAGRGLGLMASNFGLGERGLAAAATGLESFNRAATSNPLSNMLIDSTLAARGKLSDPTAYNLAHLNPSKQAEVASQLARIKRGSLSPSAASFEAQQYFYGSGGADAAMKSARTAMAASMPFLAANPSLLQGARGLSGAALRKYVMSNTVEVNGRKESILAQIQKMSGLENAEAAFAAFQAYGLTEGVLTPSSGSAGAAASSLYNANNVTARAKAQFSNQLARGGMSLLGQTLADNVRQAGVSSSAIGRYVEEFAKGGSPVTIGGALFQSTKEIETAMKLTSKSDSELMALSKGKDGGDAARALALKDTTVNQVAVQAQVESSTASNAQLVRLDQASISSLALAIAGVQSYTINKDGRPIGK